MTGPGDELASRAAGLPPPPLGGPAVLLDERKHPDRPHWAWWATLLGEDDSGTWLGSGPGTVARRGDEPARTLGGPFVTLVPHDDPWLVECYPDHPSVATYVNVGTVPVLRDGGRRVVQLDLDLDVVVRHDGTVVVEDRDEFDEHRVAHSYPDDLVALALAAARRAVELLEADPGWFAPAPWFDELRARTAATDG